MMECSANEFLLKMAGDTNRIFGHFYIHFVKFKSRWGLPGIIGYYDQHIAFFDFGMPNKAMGNELPIDRDILHWEKEQRA